MSVNLFKEYPYAWRTPSGIAKNLKCYMRLPKKIWQRIDRGWCNSDCWDLDYYILTILAGGIRFLKDHHCGHPYELSEEEWTATLDRMAWCFERGSKESADDVPFEFGIPEWNDCYKKLEEERKAALKEGFELLSKWIDSLWD